MTSQHTASQSSLLQAGVFLAGCCVILLATGTSFSPTLANVLPPAKLNMHNNVATFSAPAHTTPGQQFAKPGAMHSRSGEQFPELTSMKMDLNTRKSPTLDVQGHPPAWLSGTLQSEASKVISPILRMILVVTTMAVGWSGLKNHLAEQQWSMASTGEPEDRRLATLQNLENLLDSAAPEKPKLTEAANNTLKNMYGAMGENEASSEAPKTGPKSTLKSLEDLLGIEEPKPTEVPRDVKDNQQQEKPNAIPVEETSSSKLAGNADKSKETIVEVKSIADLINLAEEMRRVSPDDVRRMKEDILFTSGFRLTLAEESQELPRTGFVTGHLFRGNVVGDVEQTIKDVQRRTKEAFGDKYELVVIAEPPRYDEMFTELPQVDPTRPAFLLVPTLETAEPPLTGLQTGFSALLTVVTLFTIYISAFNIGLTELPISQIKALLTSDTPEMMIDVLQANLGAIFAVGVPVGASILASAGAQELGRRAAAKKYEVELGPPYFLPSIDIGTLGCITRVRSMLPSKAALFDLGAAGSLAGGSVALACLIAGLAFTASATPGDPSLVLVPNKLLESSFLLGGVLKSLFGEVGVRCHPLVLGGWTGLVLTALSTLPLGTTSGGRVMQAIVGRGRKEVAAFLTLLCLAFDALAPGLGFSWGIAAVFLQGGNERRIRDQFTALDPVRRNLGILLIMLSALLLVPFPGFQG